MTRTPEVRDRIRIKPGSPLYRMSSDDVANRTGFSEGHCRRMLNNTGQLGEPFIAAVLANTPHTFDQLFEVVHRNGAVTGGAETPEHANIPRPDFPLSWEEALGMGYVPEQGPLVPGSDTSYQDDRIIITEKVVATDEEYPVLAYQENGNIRTYGTATAASPVARIILAYLDLQIPATGDTIIPKRG